MLYSELQKLKIKYIRVEIHNNSIFSPFIGFEW